MRIDGNGQRLVIVAMFAAIIGGLCGTSEAQASRGRSRGRSSYNSSAMRARQQQAVIQAALAQRNAAQQVLAAAQSTGSEAQAKLDSALSKLKESSEQFHEAQSTTRHLAKELSKIEDDILDEQKEGSPFRKAVTE